MDEKRGKIETIVLSSSEEEDYNNDSEDQFSDSDEPSESDDTEIDDEEDEDRDEPTGSDDCDIDDESLSEKVVSLLQDGKDIDSLKLNECKAYLRKHGLRLAGNRAVCIARIKEHWRLRHESGYTLYPRSSFNINCTGDVCMGDVVLFKQKVYEKFSKMTRHGRVIGNRTVAGRVVKESYGAAKQQHTFTVEVLWSSGVRKLPPLSPLLVKGRNLYKQKTYRQRWKNEADRVKVLSEKHRRGAAARSVRALKQKKKSCYANGSKGSKRQHEAHNTKRSKKGRSRDLNKVRHFDGSRRENEYQSQEASSSAQTTWNESASSRDFRTARGRVHNSPEFDRHQPPAYLLQASSRRVPYPYQVNSQSQNGSNEFTYHARGPVSNTRGFPPFRPGASEFTYHERDPVPNMRGFPPFRPGVSEFTSRANVSSDSYRAHMKRYNFDMNNLNAEHIDRPLYLSPRDRYGGRKYGI
ncbi:zinc finger CCCH domain-containing protein 62-like isoform X2 [Vicia villosa]|uniref:zinc finger CCCH domain-containing protein 62-like isoform X2 n=1 Tax=Vicia villosa TaxID=3911 RepID=UPI00273BA5CE|nr:zinc finger CCCH domain-containing protein 62-like isoform X2 [Vicia villosa]